jgi:cytochrome P450
MPAYRLPPGPRGLPFFGNVFQFGRDQLGFLLKLQHRYGDMATIHIGRTPVVLLFRPEHIRYVLAENAANFTNREVAGGLVFGRLLLFSMLARSVSDRVTNGLTRLVGDGLLTTDGEYHDRQRRLLQPAFSKRRVESYANMIVRCASDTVEGWTAGQEIDLAVEMQALVLRVIMAMLVNIDVREEKPDVADVIDGIVGQPVSVVEGLFNLPIDLPFTPYGKRMTSLRKGDLFIYELIGSRRASDEDRGDVLSILLSATDEAGRRMTDTEVRDALVSLIAAGYETTTNTLVWTLYLLSEHPSICRGVQAELASVLGGRMPTPADLPSLTFLDQVIKESMRLYPSAWTQGRCAVRDFELDGYTIPAGTLLLFSQWALHRNPDLWPDADCFRPERWNPRSQNTTPWAYFPFGGGSRICLGKSLAQLELFLVLPIILQRYAPRVLADHRVEPLPLITLRSRHGLRSRLEAAPLVPAGVGHAATRHAVSRGECPMHKADAIAHGGPVV